MVIDGGVGAAIAILKAWVPMLPRLSTTFTVKPELPTVVGVPEITPELELIESPEGREPDEIE